MTTLTWVVGSGGMLGSAVVRGLHRAASGPVMSPRIRWGQQDALADFAAGLEQQVALANGGSWQIIWCAGAAVTSSESDRLQAEFALFSDFLDLLANHPKANHAQGSVFFASSAGAAYGGAVGAPFSERSEPVPLGEYGIAKLRAEHRLEEFSAATGMPVLIGRISNLYGPGQSLVKRQGLISELCKSSLLGRPTSIFVSLDTRRDYFYVDDCAALVVAACERLRETGTEGRTIRKIFASGRSVTIGSLLGEFRQVAGRRPLIITSASANSSLQGRDLRLTSTVWPDLDRVPKTPLVVGIAHTLADLALRLNRLGARSLV